MRIARGFWHAFCAVLLIGCTLAAVHEARAAEPPPACWPKPYGTGTYPTTSSVVEPHAEGEWSYWHCPDPFKPRAQFTWRRHDHRLVYPDTAGMSLDQALAAVWNANAKTPATDPSVASLVAAAKAHEQANGPAVPRWLVAKNGSTLTRPVYLRNADGTRSRTAVSGVRATVGQDCTCFDLARRVVDGSSTYCDPRDGVQPVVVTLCARLAE